MTEKTLTTENIKPALDALRGELAPWPVVAKKQDRLNTAQLNAANSGITSSLVAQIIANTAAIRALESAITGTGLRALVVASLPAVGTTGILYIVPVTTYDPETDADVVNYSNEYIWIPVEGGTASEGHYEQVGQTGIVINNGQLTITVNGTSVGTFTANQSGDTTAAITVPTNADYVDLSTNQTVAGVKTFSSTINGTASKAIADEDGTSIKNGYVNVAGNQTISGAKTFNSNIKEQLNYTIGETPATTTGKAIQFVSSSGADLINVTGAVYSTGANIVIISAGDRFTENRVKSPTGTIRQCTLQIGTRGNGDRFLYTDGTWRNALIPYIEYGSVSSDSGLSLGTSTNKWKTLNGINPGALSLPNPDAVIDLDTTGWDVAGALNNTYTPVVNGWLAIDIKDTATNSVFIYSKGLNSSKAYSASVYGNGSQGTGRLSLMMPAIANVQYAFVIKADSLSDISYARFYPCLGNV